MPFIANEAPFQELRFELMLEMIHRSKGNLLGFYFLSVLWHFIKVTGKCEWKRLNRSIRQQSIFHFCGICSKAVFGQLSSCGYSSKGNLSLLLLKKELSLDLVLDKIYDNCKEDDSNFWTLWTHVFFTINYNDFNSKVASSIWRQSPI